MPLREGCNDDIISENIRELIHAGRSPDVAAAIAYDQCKGAYSDDEWLALLARIQGSKGRKASAGSFIKATAPDRFEAHIVRFGNPTDKDLDEEWFSPKTYFMRNAGYSVKGRPVNYQHMMESEFGAANMAVFDFEDEDDIGMFVEAQMNNRAHYIDMLRELGRLKDIKIGDSQVKRKAELAVKTASELVTTVPLQMSMGADPAAFYVNDRTGHIDICGIVHGALTPTPADDSQPLVRFKSAMAEVANLTDERKTFIIGNVRRAKGERSGEGNSPSATTTVSSSAIAPNDGADVSRYDTPTKHKPKSNKQEDEEKESTPMNLEELIDKIAKELPPILAEILSEADMEVEKQDEEELLDEMLGKAEDDLPKDEEEIKQVEEEDEEEAVKAFIKANLGKWLPDAVTAHMNKQANDAADRKGLVADVIDNVKANAPTQSYKRKRGGFADKNVNVHTGRTEKPGVASFVKSLLRDAPRKAQNPYIGQLGGHLLGQELSTEILDILRPQVVMFNAGVRQRDVTGIGAYSIPKMTTAPSAFRPGINTQITASEGKFNVITAYLRPIAAVVDIPRQLLLTTQTNVEQHLRDEMIRSIRLQIDKEILLGVGNVVDDTGAEIKGIKTVLEDDADLSSSNIATLATNGRLPRYTDLIAAETQVTTGNVELDDDTSGWVMHPRTRGSFRSLTTTTGEPLLYDNYSVKPWKEMTGYRVHTTTQIPITDTTGSSTDTSSIYFGNYRFSEYVMGNDIEFIVDELTLANFLQIRITAYTYSDFVVHYPEAFYIMKGVRAS